MLSVEPLQKVAPEKDRWHEVVHAGTEKTLFAVSCIDETVVWQLFVCFNQSVSQRAVGLKKFFANVVGAWQPGDRL